MTSERTVKKTITFALSLALLIGACGNSATTTTTAGQAAPSREEPVEHVIREYDPPLRHPRAIAASADDIFIGTVVARLGQLPEKSPFDEYETEYLIRVERVMKGTVSGEVEVLQAGGHDPRGHFVLYDGSPMLVEGARYLLVSVNSDSKYRRLITGGRGSTRLIDQAAERDETEKWQEAVARPDSRGVPRPAPHPLTDSPEARDETRERSNPPQKAFEQQPRCVAAAESETSAAPVCSDGPGG